MTKKKRTKKTLIRKKTTMKRKTMRKRSRMTRKNKKSVGRKSLEQYLQPTSKMLLHRMECRCR